MSLKYRIRLPSERVVGPFSEEEIGELFSKKHINGTEMCQQFPIGDWKSLDKFPVLNELINNLKEKMRLEGANPAQADLPPEIPINNSKISATPKNGSKTSKQESTRTEVTAANVTFHEFKFGKDVKIEVNYDELEKEYKKSVQFI